MFFVFTAMLCKEQGITATAVCVLYEIFVVQKVKLMRYTFIIKHVFYGKIMLTLVTLFRLEQGIFS